MKRFILILLVVAVNSSYSQSQEVKIWLVNTDFCFYLGKSTVIKSSLTTAKLALVGSTGDTTWFDRRADLQTIYTPKPRFSIGDSVTAFIWNQWYNAKIIGISNKRYLIAREKFLYNPMTRIWVDSVNVEDYIYDNKYQNK